MSRSRGASSFIRSPPMINSPSVMSSNPATIRNAVDFPHPDGPTRIMNSPSPIPRFMSLTASKPSGYRFQTSLNVISAITASPFLDNGLDGRSRPTLVQRAQRGPVRRDEALVVYQVREQIAVGD